MTTNSTKTEHSRWKSKYIETPKAIYRLPPALDKNQEGVITAVDDERMHFHARQIRWVEAIFSIMVMVAVFYPLIYVPIHEYNQRIDLFLEYIERNEPGNYLSAEQERYADDSMVRLYEIAGLGDIREVAFFDSSMYIVFLAGLPLYIAMLYWLYISTKHCKDVLIFNRKKGTIYYRYNYGLKAQEVPFEEVLFQPLLSSFVIQNSSYLGLRIPKVKGTIALSSGLLYTAASFYTWYMDKYRPLPPGTVFDPFRESDYLCRRKAHFPMPLYDSGIPTPEEETLVRKYVDIRADERSLRRCIPELNRLAVEFESR